MKAWILGAAAALLALTVNGGHALGAEQGVDPYFANVPELKLKPTGPLGIVSVVQPRLFAPSSGGEGHSYYVFGIGHLTEVRLATGDLVEHAIPFDRDSRGIYDAGANAAWLAPDLKIYFGLQGKPARIGRFDPATSKMELLGALGGHSVDGHVLGPNNKCYVLTYPSTMGEIDQATGKLRDFGRLTPDGLYTREAHWVGKDGWFYAITGPNPLRKVGLNLATGEKKLLDEFPAVEKEPAPAIDFPDCSKLYTVSVAADLDSAKVTFARAGEAARTAEFRCSTAARDLHTVAVRPDGKICGTGSYQHFAWDPATGKAERVDYNINVYDYLAVGTKVYVGGYSNAYLGVHDVAKPWTKPKGQRLYYPGQGEVNPSLVLDLYRMPDTSDPAHESLKMKRSWSIVQGADGRIYVSCSATRQNRGGALVAYDPATGQAESLRAPFRFLGVPALCTIDDGKMLGIVTWTSPDPTAPGQEPPAAKLFLYDVAARKIVHESAPMPDCKVLTAICQAPGTRILAGIGLRGVTPTAEADDAFYGNGELFLFDLDKRETVKRFPFDFPLNRREGRAIMPAPDGTLWVSGGGGILRVDAAAMTVEPVARCGVSGNMVFVGNTIYMVGGPELRYGDVQAFLRKK